MNKDKLLKKIHHASRGNLFSIEVQKASKEEERQINEFVSELEREGKIKLRECVQREYSVFLHGIVKYASE
ncbi:hypothetical protein RFW18_08345 [Metabacillus idriensis]|uniref:hypothetical protein n=1 Tax=Bacillaceae TaxID=186817 RepID=UPI00105AA0F3|nr:MULTISPECIES: hypothetical protein [Bacillaceae]MDR0137759.1 hypothetical protein [Metabacillus idriensis]TDL82938.1 hypothetical protein E2R53_05205 [Peribacillus frigoritolerans]